MNRSRVILYAALSLYLAGFPALSARASSVKLLKTLMSTKGSAALDAVTIDAAGNIYLTQSNGGKKQGGSVVMLAQRQGVWTEALLHAFSPNDDGGSSPMGGVIIAPSGAIYGTTTTGGQYSSGTVYELSPNGNGTYTHSVIYMFPKQGSPQSGLATDAAGNLYGSATVGGGYGRGFVYELSPSGGGSWQKQVLYEFGAPGDGATPVSTPRLDSVGNIFGSSEYGGQFGFGAVYELTKKSGGTWSSTIIYSFTGTGQDGGFPIGPVTLDAHGNVYATAFSGNTGKGSVVESTPLVGGGWSTLLLHSFPSFTTDGQYVQGQLALDSSGISMELR
ncbi:MAG: hypothetical protein H0X25_11435 [Acidobacteriales bacterium]|nr:hypothetical protein [Terriglobales bacterium]